MIRLIFHILESGDRFLAIKNFPLNIDVQQWANERRNTFRLLRIKAIEYEDVQI